MPLLAPAEPNVCGVRSPPSPSRLQRSRMFVVSAALPPGSRGAECLLCPQPSLPAPEEPNVCCVRSPPSPSQSSRMFVVSAALPSPPGSSAAECLLCTQPSIPLPAPEQQNLCCSRSPRYLFYPQH